MEAGPNPDSEGYDEKPGSDLELIQVPAVPEVTLRILLKFSGLHVRFQSAEILFLYYYNSSLR